MEVSVRVYRDEREEDNIATAYKRDQSTAEAFRPADQAVWADEDRLAPEYD